MAESAPFRELFVELPRQLFAVLKGIGEQAVCEAQMQTREYAPSKTRGLVDNAARALRERYGWLDCRAQVMADRDSYEMRPRLACGHWHRIEVPYHALVVTPSMIDALLGVLDDHASERSCYCIPIEAS